MKKIHEYTVAELKTMLESGPVDIPGDEIYLSVRIEKKKPTNYGYSDSHHYEVQLHREWGGWIKTQYAATLDEALLRLAFDTDNAPCEQCATLGEVIVVDAESLKQIEQ